jgi:hypothetical protein
MCHHFFGAVTLAQPNAGRSSPPSTASPAWPGRVRSPGCARRFPAGRRGPGAVQVLAVEWDSTGCLELRLGRLSSPTRNRKRVVRPSPAGRTEQQALSLGGGRSHGRIRRSRLRRAPPLAGDDAGYQAVAHRAQAAAGRPLLCLIDGRTGGPGLPPGSGPSSVASLPERGSDAGSRRTSSVTRSADQLGLREGRSDDDGRRHRCSLGVGCRLLRGSGRNLRRSQRRGAREASRPKATPAEQAPRVRGWCENCAVVAVFGPGKSRGRHFGQSSRRSRSRPPPKSDLAGSEPAPYPKGGGR